MTYKEFLECFNLEDSGKQHVKFYDPYNGVYGLGNSSLPIHETEVTLFMPIVYCDYSLPKDFFRHCYFDYVHSILHEFVGHKHVKDYIVK